MSLSSSGSSGIPPGRLMEALRAASSSVMSAAPEAAARTQFLRAWALTPTSPATARTGSPEETLRTAAILSHVPNLTVRLRGRPPRPPGDPHLAMVAPDGCPPILAEASAGESPEATSPRARPLVSLSNIVRPFLSAPSSKILPAPPLGKKSRWVPRRCIVAWTSPLTCEATGTQSRFGRDGAHMGNPSIAVLVPCYNEELTVGKVVDDFRRVLPEADIWVYDNNSSDRTSEIARAHGANVRFEPRQGKGNVVRQMIRDIDADYYVMVDGDDTYPAEEAPKLLRPLLDDVADHVVGDRLSNGTYGEENKRAFHGFGNDLVRWLIKVLYGFEFNDVMTGYRAFNRAFAKTLPVLSPGFEIETELSIHAVDKRWRISQVPIDYRDRPEGSESKLNTFSDGAKVLRMIFSLLKDYKPLSFFCILALVAIVVGLILGIPVVGEFMATGLVPRLPTAILAVAFCGLGCLFFTCGLILDTIVKGARRQWETDVIRAYRDEK